MKVYKEEGVERDKPFIERDVTTLTEQVGYVDTEAQVKRMLYAGENLMAYKRSGYDFPEGDFPEDVAPDPTLEVGFDPADADMYRRKVSEKIKVAKLRAEASSRKQDASAHAGESEAKGASEPLDLT